MTYRDGRLRRVYTHSARHSFDYAYLQDLSEWNLSDIIDKIKKYGIAKVSFKIDTRFKDEKTENEYNL